MNEGGRDPLGSPDEPSAACAALFGPRLALACQYAQLLATDGVGHGLIGPREVSRLWDRHLANCALVADLLPAAARVVDVGSGAGLPGLPLAIRRPDLRIDLVEPMLRRTTFLARAVDELGLSGAVRVVRGRAEEPAVGRLVGRADWVTARAVAPLDRLVRWCLPLVSSTGTLLALKGSSAEEELAEHSGALQELGAASARVVQLEGAGLSPTWVIAVERSATSARRTTKGRR
ncbi:MAG: 16S rRNA (guanine(527)-N(7))-methyltransferase RsmG [Jatrophihabitans sp.]